MSVNQNNGKNDKGKICLIDILSWKQILGTKAFGFLLLCSFAVVLTACGGIEVTAIEEAVAGSTQGCTTEVKNFCELAEAEHGSNGIGTCSSGRGECAYTCNDDGEWEKLANSCAPAPQGCTAQVKNFCELAEADHGSNGVGTCSSGTGECAYTCNDDGEWGLPRYRIES